MTLGSTTMWASEGADMANVLGGVHSAGSSPRAVDVTSRNLAFHGEFESVKFDGFDDFRIVTYNIHGWRDTDHKDNFDRVLDFLLKVNADVVVLQEVLHPYCPPSEVAERELYFSRVKAGKGNGYEALASNRDVPYLNLLSTNLGMKYMSFGCATSDGYFGKFGYGNAILSRLPIVREQHLVVRPDARHQAGRRIEAEDRCFSAVTVTSQLSKIISEDLVSDRHTVTICVTHLDQLSDELRCEQIRAMLKAAAPLGRHILCGDLNVFQRSDTPQVRWDAILADAVSKGWPAPPEESTALDELIAAGYQDCFFQSDNHRRGLFHKRLWCEGMSCDTEFPSATCWVTKPLLRIDYAFLSPSNTPAIMDTDGSDRISNRSDSEEGSDSGFSLAASCGGECWARVLQYQRVDVDGSDHFPVVIDLAIPHLAKGSHFATGDQI